MTLPPTETHFLDDGSVEVRVGTQIGWVTSAHLIETKIHQLQTAWLEAQTKGGEALLRNKNSQTAENPHS